ncbi:MAG: pyridine nucleotide-disulfide oxidoreductase [Planctomycetota bacterium]|jgi:NADPH-dependent glutamate synthase beta subunit-like oxidoreductase/NAD(P)H-flavin reductase
MSKHATSRSVFDGKSLAGLQTPDELARLFTAFRERLTAADGDLAARYGAWLEGADVPAKQEADLLVDVARHVSGFVVDTFGLGPAATAHRERVTAERRRFAFRKRFVARRAARRSPDPADDVDALQRDLEAALGAPWSEQSLTDSVLAALDAEEADGNAPAAPVLDLAERWVAAALATDRAPAWPSLRLQHKVNWKSLVRTEPAEGVAPGALAGPPAELRRRDGFGLTDDRGTLADRLGQIDTCLICHPRGVDSCRKGLHDKAGEVKHNPLGIPLDGCPLDERISEAHVLADEGDPIGALALVMIDNPMCPGTGHRICNDCMKACIFQNQDPVDIPRAETGTLTDVLDMPWGVEVYSLLARWNPLNRSRPHALPYNGVNVLVVGLGPAGYTLAHFLLNEGFGVVGVDGLKIEPLPPELLDRPIPAWSDLVQPLDARTPSGFGGVSEYGITVRWDKNFLRLIQLTLARRQNFTAYGGVRFGGTLELEDCWTLGFHHVAMATGAGRPTIIDMQNNLTRGVRKASDFLMGLQLSGAFQRESLANLQVELPALVVGGGLTAIDTATELMAYYPVQVERLLARHEKLSAQSTESEVLARLTEPEREIHDRFLGHARALREERRAAEAEGREPDFVPLLREWGGVTICYRKGLDESPAYRLNHEEVIKAFEEGISFLEGVVPLQAVDDRHDAIKTVVFDRLARDENGKWRSTGESLPLPARSLFVAAGTSPNVIYEKEHPGTFQLDGRKRFFQTCDDQGNPSSAGFLTSYADGDRRVSFYGDNHPTYAGNVVKAMASAKYGFPHVVSLFSERLAALDVTGQTERDADWTDLRSRLDDLLLARVVRVERLTPTIVDVVVHAPLAARHFQPGQFYRLQNYETSAPVVNGTRLVMEGLALTGAWVDREQGLLSMIVLEMGGSSSLCALLREGEEVVVMGPTGAPTEIPSGETVALVGGGLGNAVLFSIAGALKAAGNRVLYFAGYRNSEDIFKRAQIEAATDAVIWCCDAGPDIPVSRPTDAFFRGNMVQAMAACGRGEFPGNPIEMRDVKRMIVIGSDGMMAAVKEARRGELAPYLGPHVAIGSINSPMQCMMKEVCAQCLQRHVDPVTGNPVEPVFSCFNQDQLLDAVDFGNLHERLGVNSVLEKATARWIAHLLAERSAPAPSDGTPAHAGYDVPST